MAQSPRETTVVAIHQPNTSGAAAASPSAEEMANARAYPRTIGLARCLPSLRHQIAVARTLLDELEDRGQSSSLVRARSTQVIEELTRLGSLVLDAATVLAQHQEAEREERKRG
jgi:hypothetical protein